MFFSHGCASVAKRCVAAKGFLERCKSALCVAGIHLTMQSPLVVMTFKDSMHTHAPKDPNSGKPDGLGQIFSWLCKLGSKEVLSAQCRQKK